MFILMLCFWLLLVGHITPETLLLGLVLCAAICLLENRLFGFTLKKEWQALRKTPLFCVYFFVLLAEILKAGFLVSRDILFKNHMVTPTLVTFEADLKTDFGRFLLANSITLTPGTITIRVIGNQFTVHCLDKAMLDTSQDSTFLRWIRRLEA